MSKPKLSLLFLTAGDFVQQAGMHLQSVAVAAFTYGMTGSAWAYALQQTLAFVPWMLFPGIAGLIVDRLDRRRVLIVAGLFRGFAYFWYPYCRSLGPILALTFMGSACGVFIVTARTALIPSLAPKPCPFHMI